MSNKEHNGKDLLGSLPSLYSEPGEDLVPVRFRGDRFYMTLDDFHRLRPTEPSLALIE